MTSSPEQELHEPVFDALFEYAPISILKEDWSGVKLDLDLLKARGVDDIDRYVCAHPELIAEVHKKHRYVDVNQSVVQFFAASNKQSFLAEASQLLPADYRSHIVMLRALFRGERMAQGERTLRMRDGQLRTVLWRTTIPDTLEGLRGMLFYCIEVTEQKRAEESLTNAQAELAHAGRVLVAGELAASIAHEVNQPLAAISAFASAAGRWLKRKDPQIDNALSDLEKIGATAEIAGAVVGRIRSFVRKTPTDMRALTPHELIIDALSLVRWQATRSGVSARAHIEARLPAVLGDAVQIQQVLVNLMVNAIQAMAEESHGARELHASARLIGGAAVLFEVRDTGPGVPEAEVERIFKPFLSGREGGMGMGLAICRTIVCAHGGRLTVSDAHPRGAVFSFTIPIASQPDLAGAAGIVTASSGFGASPVSVSVSVSERSSPGCQRSRRAPSVIRKYKCNRRP